VLEIRTVKRLLGIGAILGAGAAYSARPMDPWVLRVTMPAKVRILMMALGPNLSVAYDAPNCALYEAWSGTYVDGNTTYNHQQGVLSATYNPRNTILYKQAPGGSVSETPVIRPLSPNNTPPNETPVAVWSATQGGAAAAVKPDFRGHSFNAAGDIATLRYRLAVGGASIDVEEVPDLPAGGSGLQRDFNVPSLPQGTVLSLLLTGNLITKAAGGNVSEEWTATGDGRVETRNGKRYLVLDKAGKTRLLGTWK
jgi:hypothetical protein